MRRESSLGPALPEDPDALPAGGGPLFRWPERLLDLAGGAALVFLMALTVADALMRSLLNRPILGGGDLVQVTLVVVVAASIPLSIAAGRAIAIDALVALLPEGARRVLLRATSAVSALALGYLAWRCHLNAGEAATFGETTMLLQIPFGPFYRALSIAFGLAAFLFVVEATRGRRLG